MSLFPKKVECSFKSIHTNQSVCGQCTSGKLFLIPIFVWEMLSVVFKAYFVHTTIIHQAPEVSRIVYSSVKQQLMGQ